MTDSNKAIFLSYASQDAEAAARICEALRAAGIEVWFDQSELRGGDAWDTSIRKQIKACSLFMPIISVNTHAREEGYFRLEWKLAVDRSHLMAGTKAFVVPVVIDDTRDDDERTPEKFREVQWTRIPGGETPAGFCERVGVLLGGDEPTAASKRNNTHIPDAGTLAKTLRHWMIPVCGAVLVALIAGVWVYRMAHPGTAAAPAVAAPVVTAPEKSIAVLPFVDMSEKKDQEYFADGLSEELIDRLAHSTDLKVIARTSSFAFKGKNEDMRTIARMLGVANLLEGSVRKAGTDLRITAQLIRASDGVHLWSQSFDRTMTDIFKVQEEISDTVAKALHAAFETQAPSANIEATSVDAYSEFLKGNFFFWRGSQGDNERASKNFERALAIDPQYALAWAQLSRVYCWQAIVGERRAAEMIPKARAAVQRALAIDPTLALAHYVLGLVLRFADYDWHGAKSENQKVIALHASGELGAYARENILEIEAQSSGQTRDILALYLDHTKRNPLDTTTLWSLAYFQIYANHLKEAADTSRKVLELNPDFATARAQLGQALLLMGKNSEAMAATVQESDEATKLSVLACIHWSMGKRSQSDAMISQLEQDVPQTSAFYIASAHACRGEADAAMAWLERAYSQRDGQLVNVKLEPFLRNLRGRARFKALLKKMNLPEG